MKRFLMTIAIILSFTLFGETQDKALRSLTEERKDILRYGIENEIIELLGSLKAEKDVSLVDEIALVLENSPIGKIQKEIFDYMRALKRREGVPGARKYLSEREETRPELLAAILGYLSDIEEEIDSDTVYPLLESKNTTVVSAAVRYIGRTKAPGAGSKLMELYEKEETSLQLRGEIVLALGDLKDAAATPFLISLLEDEDEDLTLRRYACDALGKSGDRNALPSIKNAMDSKDNILRSYAIASLGHFPGDDTIQILMMALRDSFPRVRELAAEKLGELGASEAVDILIYRARRDQEKKVRQAAFRGLSKIGGGSAVNFLQEFLEGEKNPLDYRSLAAEELIERRPESAASPVLKVMDQEWTKDNSFLLDAVCKLLSQKEYSGFDGLYERMLQHKSFIIQIYGIRGIQKNRVSRLRADVEKFTNEKFHPQLRRTAMAALEVL